MLKDFLNTRERKTATWIKRFDDASIEERVILLENLDLANEPSNTITEEIEQRLKEIVRTEPRNRYAELAIRNINDKDFLVDLLEKDHLAESAADNLARDPIDQISDLIRVHPKILQRKILSTSRDDLPELVPYITTAATMCDLIIKANPELRDSLLKNEIFKTEQGLSLLEKTARQKDKTCYKFARNTLAEIRSLRKSLSEKEEEWKRITSTYKKAVAIFAKTRQTFHRAQLEFNRIEELRRKGLFARDEIQALQSQLLKTLPKEKYNELPIDNLNEYHLDAPKVDPFEEAVVLLRNLAAENQKNPEDLRLNEQKARRLWGAALEKYEAEEKISKEFKSLQKTIHSFLWLSIHQDELFDLMGSIPNVDQTKLESMPIDEVQIFTQSSQEWLKLARKFLKMSREDNVKAVELGQIQELVRSSQQLESNLEEAQRRITSERENLNQIIRTGRELIDKGRSIEAARMAARAKKYRSISGAAARKKLGEINRDIKRLNNWKSFADAPKKELLLEQMKDLSRNPLDPKNQLERIKSLRASWNNLLKGSQHKDSSQKDFDAAAESAFSICESHFAEQNLLKVRNTEKQKRILEQITAFLDQQNLRSTPTKILEEVLRRARSEWNETFPSQSDRLKERKEQFEKSQRNLHELIKEKKNENQSTKESLIERAHSLCQEEPSQMVIEEIKEIQAEWRKIDRTHEKNEQVLWKKFKDTCDQIFNQRRLAKSDERALLQEKNKEIEAKLTQVSNLIREDNLQNARKLFKDIEIETDSNPHGGGLLKKIEEVKSALDELEAKSKLKRKQQALEDIKAWDLKISRFEEEGGEPPQPPGSFFTQRLSGSGSVESSLTLTLEAEIIAAVASPETDKEERIKTQLALINKGIKPSRDISNDELLKRWCGIGPKSKTDDPLRERFFKALAVRTDS